MLQVVLNRFILFFQSTSPYASDGWHSSTEMGATNKTEIANHGPATRRSGGIFTAIVLPGDPCSPGRGLAVLRSITSCPAMTPIRFVTAGSLNA